MMVDDKDLIQLAEELGLTPEASRLIGKVVAETSRRWPNVAHALNLTDDRRLAQSLAKHYKLPFLETLPATIDIVGLNLPAKSFLRSRHAVPLAVKDGVLHCAVADPGDESVIRALRSISGASIALQVASFSAIEAHLEQQFDPDLTSLLDATVGSESHLADLDARALRDLADRAPVIRLVDQILADALRLKASDIHIESMRSCIRVRARIDGLLRPLRDLTPGLGPPVISRLKVLGGMDVANRRAPQDGRAGVIVRGKSVDMRLSTVPGLHGETAAIRLLDRNTAEMDLSALGFSKAAMEVFSTLLLRPQGMMLVTGPTGHGKTTTLYALLRRLRDGARKILTVEDPIEYELDDVTQVQVNEAAGVSFSSALRAFLRQDPDIMLIGEIRDSETAHLASQAALTGHLVLASLHTNDAPSSVTRLRNLGLEPYLIASTLSGVIAQRLVRQLCGCAQPELNPIASSPLLEQTLDRRLTRLQKPMGCQQCGGTGFQGRFAIAEGFAVDPADRACIAAEGEDGLRRLLQARHWPTMTDDGLLRAEHGETTLAEVARVTTQ